MNCRAKSPKRISRSNLPKRKSPKRKSRSVRRKSHNMLRGGTEAKGICDTCFEPLSQAEGQYGYRAWINRWIHKDQTLCRQNAAIKSQRQKK